MIFGDHDHKTFLGCLCSEYDPDSVLNEYGKFGNPYSSTTLFNEFGPYGSEFSNTSPCNSFATDPPVVVTSSGTFVGYLTINEFKTGAISDDDVINWLKTKVCKH